MIATIELASGGVEPGGPIAGVVRWAGRAQTVRIALWWQTKGKGDPDKETVQSITYPVADGGRSELRFELVAPFAPFTFSGKLISVIYTLTATVAASGGTSEANVEVVIAPNGVEVVLAST